jgi:hypothetical protein
MLLYTINNTYNMEIQSKTQRAAKCIFLALGCPAYSFPPLFPYCHQLANYLAKFDAASPDGNYSCC